MRFLYIAPRYHTNQAPIMKCLKEAGHEVCFLSHYQGRIEDYSCVQPVIVGYSKIFCLWEKFYVNVLHKKNCRAVDMKLRYGIPSALKIRKLVKDFKPDVIIIRERSLYSMVTYMACRNLHIPSILYNQSPLWEKEIKNDLPHRIVKSMLPKVRMTPVFGTEDKSHVREDNTVFIPFVIEPKLEPKSKNWFHNGKINILCIGKYEKRKNIRMLLEIIDEVKNEYDINLTVVGECSTHFHQEYKELQEQFIQEHGLQNEVKLLQNLNRTEIEEVYKTTDLFIIPSTDEPASISQLEAMAFSIPVICSNKNGTACYVKHEKTGFWFQDNQKDDLRKVIKLALKDKERLITLGIESFRSIQEECSFSCYFTSIRKCMDMANKLAKRNN